MAKRTGYEAEMSKAKIGGEASKGLVAFPPAAADQNDNCACRFTSAACSGAAHGRWEIGRSGETSRNVRKRRGLGFGGLGFLGILLVVTPGLDVRGNTQPSAFEPTTHSECEIT